jgi:hypothetical protein
MLSSNTNVGRTANHPLTSDLPNLPDAQLVLECRLCKVDTTLYIATNFHDLHSYQFPLHFMAYLTRHNKMG